MKRKLIAALTGIAMSLALSVTGCAGTTGTTGTVSAAGSAASETDTGITQGNSADSNANADASADGSQTDPSGNKKQKGTGDGRGSEKPSGKKSKDSDSGETTAELKTVEPGTYAGQTVYGKVTSISDSQITVKLGTYNKDASVMQTSVTEDAAEVIEAVAASDDNSTDTSSGNTDAKSKKKKSRFTANGEQMTVTIPESLSGIEIKEKYVLSITLDDQGNVTAIEVVSKGRSKLKGPDSGKDGSGSESGQDTENSTDINDKETNNL